jgi:hypothetical protein
MAARAAVFRQRPAKLFVAAQAAERFAFVLETCLALGQFAC